MTEFFTELAKKEKGKLQIIDEVVVTGLGERSPHMVWQLKIAYKGREIRIKNEIGITGIGFFTCVLKEKETQSKFSIRTISNFLRLFVDKERSFIIKCKNRRMQLFLENNETLKALEKLTIETQLEPLIYINKAQGVYKLIAEYNLIFVDREEVMIILIQFFKDFIDRFEIKYNHPKTNATDYQPKHPQAKAISFWQANHQHNQPVYHQNQ